MTDASDPSDSPAHAEGAEEDVDTADVSGGAVPEQLLEDGEGDGRSQQ